MISSKNRNAWFVRDAKHRVALWLSDTMPLDALFSRSSDSGDINILRRAFRDDIARKALCDGIE